ncbi:MAG: type III polyketide synthase [Thermodesulfobacteriales bacterium]|nr:MAG: type III polyketide synthase [Thermodesulfobacteriales bacterium]
MSRVISVGTAAIPYTFDQSEVREFANELFTDNKHYINRMLGVFDNSLIETRHFVHSREWFDTPKNFVQRSESFLKNALLLSISAIKDCLKKTDADLNEIDHIIFVTSTGIATPSVDAHMINELKLDPHIKRTPIWGLGCVGGAVGLTRAMEYTKAFPESAVLVVAVEICSLAFHREDYSKSNIVSLALFSDGAAASLVSGKEHRLSQSSQIRLISSLSTTYYDSLGVMGWEVVDDGFKAIFSKDIPTIVRKEVKSNIEELLSTNNVTISDLKQFAVHPGGAKVLLEYEGSLGLAEGTFKHSRKVLKEHGNMSSPTVLYVLKEIMDEKDFNQGEYGIISALGPGFSSEIILFEIV